MHTVKNYQPGNSFEIQLVKGLLYKNGRVPKLDRHTHSNTRPNLPTLTTEVENYFHVDSNNCSSISDNTSL